jgi:hypothetical protein
MVGMFILIKQKQILAEHIYLEYSKQKAIEFILELKNHLAKYLEAGNPLEP